LKRPSPRSRLLGPTSSGRNEPPVLVRTLDEGTGPRSARRATPSLLAASPSAFASLTAGPVFHVSENRSSPIVPCPRSRGIDTLARLCVPPSLSPHKDDSQRGHTGASSMSPSRVARLPTSTSRSPARIRNFLIQTRSVTRVRACQSIKEGSASLVGRPVGNTVRSPFASSSLQHSRRRSTPNNCQKSNNPPERE
jgi:hypothetical protein